MNYHTITIPANDTALHVIIRPDSAHDVYDVYVKYMGFPNASYYDWKTEVCNLCDTKNATCLCHVFNSTKMKRHFNCDGCITE